MSELAPIKSGSIMTVRCGGVRTTSPGGSDFGYTTYDAKWVLITDLDPSGRSVTNDPSSVILALHKNLHGFEHRRVLYQNTFGNLDELMHDGNGRFTDYAPVELEPATAMRNRFETLRIDNAT